MFQYPSIPEIEAIAFNREDSALYALFESGELRDWEHYSLAVFYSLVRGAEAGLAGGKRPQVVLRRMDPVIKLFLQRISDIPACPKVVFLILDRWTGVLFRLKQYAELIPLLNLALERKVRRYPSIEIGMRQRLAGALFELGNLEDSYRLYIELAQRPYLIQDTVERYSVTEQGAVSGLLAGLPVDKNFKALLWHSRSSRVAVLYRGIVGMVLSREGSAQAKMFVGLARLGQVLHRVPGMSRLFGTLRRFAVFIEKSFVIQQLYNLPPALDGDTNRPCPQPAPKPILVTRAMGGLGDLLMMTPGLAALKAKYPEREIHFAIPSNFHMLFEGNTDVVVKDINGAPLVRENYHGWYDLTDCPAAKVESLTAPNVKKNRIDIFAESMGIGRARLRQTGLKPRYTVTAEERDWAKQYLQQRECSAANLIGVQLYSADTYKDYPHMNLLVQRLAKDHQVLVFHGEKITGYDMENVWCIDNTPIRQSAALASLCRLIICPDSSFLHLAAALDIPAVVVSGPVCGKVQTLNYTKARYIDQRSNMPCVPCWRNEDSPCLLTGRYTSECLKTLPTAKILEAVEQVLRGKDA